MKKNLPELELIIAHSLGEGLEPAVPFSVMTNFFTPRDGCYCGSRHRHGKLAQSMAGLPTYIIRHASI